MQTFKQITEKIAMVLSKTTNTKKQQQLQNLLQQVATKEIYYNNIPSIIKTKSTLRYIIESLTFKLNQIIYNDQQQINTNYKQNTSTNTVDDTITVAYLQQNTTNTLQHINALQNATIANLQQLVNETQAALDASNARIVVLETQLSIVRDATNARIAKKY